MDLGRLIGLPEEEARLLCEHYNFSLRVTGEDGEFYLCTCDYVTTRVNVYIADGVVAKASIG